MNNNMPKSYLSKNTNRVLLSIVDMNWCHLGVEYAKKMFSDVEILCWDTGDPYPNHIKEWNGDWIISYRGDFIFPEYLYRKAKKGAINFHPAPPKYRGLGSQHYAIYYGDKTYGSTCHHLDKSVDTGTIIDVERFTISPLETASSLRYQVGVHCLAQFLKLLANYILPEKPLPISNEEWGKHLYKQSEIDDWLKKMQQHSPLHPSLI